MQRLLLPSESVPVVEVTTPELPRDSQKAEIGTPVVHTPAVDSAIVDDVAIATIGQGEVADKSGVSLFTIDEMDVASEQVSDDIYVPIFPVPKRGWYRWCDSAALAVGNLINNGIGYFLSDEISKFKKVYNFENIWKISCFNLL